MKVTSIRWEERFTYFCLLFMVTCGTIFGSSQYTVHTWHDIAPGAIMNSNIGASAAIAPTKLSGYDPTGKTSGYVPKSDGSGGITWGTAGLSSESDPYSLHVSGGTMAGDILSNSNHAHAIGAIGTSFNEAYIDYVANKSNKVMDDSGNETGTLAYQASPAGPLLSADGGYHLTLGAYGMAGDAIPTTDMAVAVGDATHQVNAVNTYGVHFRKVSGTGVDPSVMLRTDSGGNVATATIGSGLSFDGTTLTNTRSSGITSESDPLSLHTNGGAMTGTITSMHINPLSDGTYSLGTSLLTYNTVATGEVFSHSGSPLVLMGGSSGADSVQINANYLDFYNPTVSSSAGAGSASALPAQPATYLVIHRSGTSAAYYYIPCYLAP